MPHFRAARASTSSAIPTRGHAALRRGRVSLPGHVYLVTVVVAGRAPLFSRFDAACAAARCFAEPRLHGDAHLVAWVLMPDHAHWLLQLGPREPLPTLASRLKSASARAVNAALGRSGPLWSRAFHDRALRHDEDVATAAGYVIDNPLRAGLVRRRGDYPFWDCIHLPPLL